MVKKILIILTILILFLVYQPVADCLSIKDNFRIFPEALMIQLEGEIHADTGIPIALVRFFHNKPTFFGLEILRRLLSFGDINFLVNLPFCILR